MAIVLSLLHMPAMVSSCESDCAADTDCRDDWTKCTSGYCCGDVKDSNGATWGYNCVASSATTYTCDSASCTVSCVSNVYNSGNSISYKTAAALSFLGYTGAALL